MKYRRLLGVCCIAILPGISPAQLMEGNTGSYPANNGQWNFVLYDPHILKTTFQPSHYTNNEQVSNAVIIQPATKKVVSPRIQLSLTEKGSLQYRFDDKKLVLSNYFDSTSFRGFRFQLKENEMIFGTGERSVPVNRRGYKLDLYNQPNYGYGLNAVSLNYSVPLIISSDGYGIFFDNPSRGYLDIGKTDPTILEYGASSGELSFYIITGKNVDEIIRRYHLLTGTQPIPARWVLGNLMSRFGYRSESQLAGIVNKMQEQRIPIDAVILDLFWFGDSIKGTMGNLDWVNKRAWPDPGKMISDLKARGIKTVLITEPYILNTTPSYEPTKKFHATDSAGNPFLLTNFYFGNGGLLDIFRTDAQDWFWSKYKKQIQLGVEGWWGDLGEPEQHPVTIRHSLKDLGFKRLFTANEVHNIYGHYWDKMLFEKYAREYPATRLFNLNRSGYAGSPRYGVFPWSGDVSRSWSGLQAQLPLMIGMSLSGVPYIHADAGGFAGGDGDTELYTRWMQFAVFTPVFRPHGTALGELAKDVKDIPSEAALYDEPVRSIVRKYIRLRYQLLPYNYTLTYEQARFGKPLVRPLFYFDNRDTNYYRATDQYMWGDHILVAPVLEKGAARRLLYLPEGNWYNYFSGNVFPGRNWINEKVGADDIPVFVKEGSFIPLFGDSIINNTLGYNGKKISLKYYPCYAKTEYTLFDDDGHTNHTIKNGKYELIHFEGLTTGKDITIKITPGNNYVMFAREIKISLPGAIKMASAIVDNKKQAIENNSLSIRYEGKPVMVRIMK